jgi:hypothetical protein
MELKLYQKDIHPDSKNTHIDDLTEEDFGYIVDNIFNLTDRITYHCPTGLVKYLKHEDKNLIGKIGVENLSDESLIDYEDGGFAIPTRIPFLDGIYDEYDMISDNKQVITEFVERKSISHEEFQKERNRLLEIRNRDLPAKLEKALSEIRPKFVEEMDASKYDGKSESSTVHNFKDGNLKLAFKKTVDFLKSECIGFNIEEYMIFREKSEKLREINSNEFLKITKEIQLLDDIIS